MRVAERIQFFEISKSFASELLENLEEMFLTNGRSYRHLRRFELLQRKTLSIVFLFISLSVRVKEMARWNKRRERLSEKERERERERLREKEREIE